MNGKKQIKGAVVCRPGIRLCPLQGRKERHIFSIFIAFTVGVGKFLIRTIFFVDAG